MAQNVAKGILADGFTNYVSSFGTATPVDLEQNALETMASSLIKETTPGTLDVPITSLELTRLRGLQEMQSALRFVGQFKAINDKDRMLEQVSQTYSSLRNALVY